MPVTAPDGCAVRIATEVSARLSMALDPAGLRLLRRPRATSAVSDEAQVLRLPTPGGAPGLVILVSNPAFPEAVAEAAVRSRTVADMLDAQTAAHVLCPLSEGRCDGRSYAAFREAAPVPQTRLLRSLHLRGLKPHLAGWLTEVARQTRHPCEGAAFEAAFQAPLSYLAQESALPSDLRALASRSVAEAGASRLFTVVEHGDFWPGNILLEPGRPRLGMAWSGRFQVIDWGSARPRGYPFADLLRLCMTTPPAAPKAQARFLARYCADLALSRHDAAIYALAALGRIGLNRGQFPFDRYRGLVRRSLGFLQDLAYL